MGPASDDFDMTDSEVVIVPEVSAKMGVVDTTHMLVMPCFLVSRLVMPFLLPGVVVALLVSVLVLGKSGERSSEEQHS